MNVTPSVMARPTSWGLVPTCRYALMPYNLEPRLDALESALERGALMRIDRSAKSFQATASR